MENIFDSDNSLDYMFNIPEKYQIRQTMLSYTLLELNELREIFYKTDLTLLDDFSVINNVHAEYRLGCYIVRNDFVEDPFIRSDDFDLEFSIKEYNEAKKNKILTQKYDYFEQLDRFRDDKYIKSYIIEDEYLKEFNLKTKWNIVTKNDSPIALISEHDSDRLIYINKYEFKKIRVKNLEEGIEFIKVFKL